MPHHEVRLSDGAVILAAGLAGGVFAAPAQADPANNVTDFLNSLDSLGLGGIDPAKAVSVGQSLCPVLAERGQNTADIASTVSTPSAARSGRRRCSPVLPSHCSARKQSRTSATTLANGKLIPIPIFGN